MLGMFRCAPVLSAALAMLVLVASPRAIAGTSDKYEPPVTLERMVETVVLNEDGSYRKTRESVIRIETPAAISDMGVQRVSYSGLRETIDSVEGWIIQPDGTKLVVPPESVRTQEEGTDGGSTEFSDTKYKVIVFPQVRVGSRLYVKTEAVTHTPLFAGEFFRNFELPSELEVDYWEFNVVLPRDKTLYVEQRGVAGGLTETSQDSQTYRFTYKRPSSVAPDQIEVDSSDYADVLRVSTLPDLPAVGRLYQAGAAPQSVVTERVRAKALSLTSGLTEDREKAQVLYDWVSRNIRYVGVWMGSGGYVPHSADEVLAKEYGDCKDHVTLLGALLEAVGIASSPALVNLGSSYTLSKVGTFTPLNHAITYVPSLEVYLDSTAQFAPFGRLPFSDSDKPVILTALGRLGRTPAVNAQTNTTRTRVSLVVDSDGYIRGTSRATMSGNYEISARLSRFGDRGTPEEQLVKGQLSRFGETGTGSIRHTDPQDIDSEYWTEGDFRLDPVSNLPGQGALKVPVGLAPGSLAVIARDKPAERQQHSYPCASRTVTENYQIQFPSDVSISGLPKGTSYQDGPIRYRSTYTRTGREVTIDRVLVIERESQVCSPDDMVHWRAFHEQLQRDLRSQIVYR